MARYASRFVLLVVIALATVSCRSAPVYNVEHAPYTTKAPSLDAADMAVKRAGAGLGWQMKTVEPGLIVASLPLRTHLAIVDVSFNQEDFSIKYKSSTNLNYDGTNIHSNYNGWVQNLRDAIIAQSSLF